MKNKFFSVPEIARKINGAFTAGYNGRKMENSGIFKY